MKGRIVNRHDNSDVQAVIGGQLVDQRIEALVEHLRRPFWTDTDLETLLNEIVQEFVKHDCPWINIHEPIQPQIFGFNLFVAVPGTEHWPVAFNGNPDMQVAVAIAYRETDDEGEPIYTDYAGGARFDQALLLAVVQYAREKSVEMYSQGTLRLS